MKKNFLYTVMMVVMCLTTGCSNDDNVMAEVERDQPRSVKNEKTVLIYMAGRNSLTDAVAPDLDEIKAGSRRIGDGQNLLVFVRRYNETDQPWLARIKKGEVIDSVSLKDMGVTSSDGQNRASDPVVMEGVMRYAFSHYPASTGHYGLVLWGHGSGWLLKNEVAPRYTRAFGVDYGYDQKSKDERWLNIPMLAEILSDMPHLKFIMADCCNFMCLENLYELRNVCDYIIGSPAEIPDQGAPYDEIVPDFFANGTFYANIINKYYKSMNGYLPLTAVKTSEMEQLAQVTRHAMQSVKATIGEGYADMTGLIHYYYTDKGKDFYPEYNIFYDAGDFFLAHAPQDVYQQWHQALGQAVVDCRMATIWNTDKKWWIMYSDFMMTAEKFHGVSMFVPQDPRKGNYAKYNEDIKRLSWYKIVEGC